MLLTLHASWARAAAERRMVGLPAECWDAFEDGDRLNVAS